MPDESLSPKAATRRPVTRRSVSKMSNAPSRSGSGNQSSRTGRTSASPSSRARGTKTSPPTKRSRASASSEPRVSSARTLDSWVVRDNPNPDEQGCPPRRSLSPDMPIEKAVRRGHPRCTRSSPKAASYSPCRTPSAERSASRGLPEGLCAGPSPGSPPTTAVVNDPDAATLTASSSGSTGDRTTLRKKLRRSPGAPVGLTRRRRSSTEAQALLEPSSAAGTAAAAAAAAAAGDRGTRSSSRRTRNRSTSPSDSAKRGSPPPSHAASLATMPPSSAHATRGSAKASRKSTRTEGREASPRRSRAKAKRDRSIEAGISRMSPSSAASPRQPRKNSRAGGSGIDCGKAGGRESSRSPRRETSSRPSRFPRVRASCAAEATPLQVEGVCAMADRSIETHRTSSSPTSRAQKKRKILSSALSWGPLATGAGGGSGWAKKSTEGSGDEGARAEGEETALACTLTQQQTRPDDNATAAATCSAAGVENLSSEACDAHAGAQGPRKRPMDEEDDAKDDTLAESVPAAGADALPNKEQKSDAPSNVPAIQEDETARKTTSANVALETKGREEQSEVTSRKMDAARIVTSDNGTECMVTATNCAMASGASNGAAIPNGITAGKHDGEAPAKTKDDAREDLAQSHSAADAGVADAQNVAKGLEFNGHQASTSHEDEEVVSPGSQEESRERLAKLAATGGQGWAPGGFAGREPTTVAMEPSPKDDEDMQVMVGGVMHMRCRKCKTRFGRAGCSTRSCLDCCFKAGVACAAHAKQFERKRLEEELLSAGPSRGERRRLPKGVFKENTIHAIGDTATIWCFKDFLCAKSNHSALKALSRSQAVEPPGGAQVLPHRQCLANTGSQWVRMLSSARPGQPLAECTCRWPDGAARMWKCSPLWDAAHRRKEASRERLKGAVGVRGK